MIRVVLVDDHAIVREGQRSLLEHASDIVVVGSAPNGEALLLDLEAWVPDVVVLDMRMPGGMDGSETTRRIRAMSPHTQVVLFTAYRDVLRIVAGFRAGAIGYVSKDQAAQDLVPAIRAAARGDITLEPDIAVVLHAGLVEHGRHDTLTTREQDVLAELIHGRSNDDISVALGISKQTVMTHVKNILAKLQRQEPSH